MDRLIDSQQKMNNEDRIDWKFGWVYGLNSAQILQGVYIYIPSIVDTCRLDFQLKSVVKI